VKLSHVIEELVEERGLDRETLSAIMGEGMLAAYEKKYPEYVFTAAYNRKTDEIEILATKNVVEHVADEAHEISLKKARAIDVNAEIGKQIAIHFDKPIGRIEILKAKQIIAQKIKNIESEAIYKEFKPKEGSVVHGTIHKCERNGFLVKIGESFAFLAKTATLPTDNCMVGFSVRALLKDVLIEPRNEYQLFLDRISPEFVQRLFELEIPEVFEKIVEIKKIVRIAGYKTKMIVTSNDKNIDPVGTCIGVGGVRIKPILKELGSEKIDIISMGDTIEDLVADALKPAIVEHVKMIAADTVEVIVSPDQRSVAIGKQGNNITLASNLTGLRINLVGESERKTLDFMQHDQNEQEPVE